MSCRGRVLIIAGSDSGGGAGIQADLKAVTALGGYAATAITALTAQDTRDVYAIEEVAPDFVRRQIDVVLADIGADCLKTGMLHRAEIIEVVADALETTAAGLPLVADPVMVAKGGARLLDPATGELLKTRLLPRATVLTPNIPEAEALTGMTIRNVEEMIAAAHALAEHGPKDGPRAVLVKGGHLEGDELTDVLLVDGAVELFSGPRIATRHTHGTGCTLASAIATGIAQGMSISHAVRRARDYVAEAIRTAPGFGAGHGPLNHGHTVRPFEID